MKSIVYFVFVTWMWFQPIQALGVNFHNIFVSTDLTSSQKDEEKLKIMKMMCELIDYPHWALIDGVEGHVVTQFVVEEDGTITNFRILESSNARFSAEVKRVISRISACMQVAEKKEVTRVTCTVPVLFHLDNKFMRILKPALLEEIDSLLTLVVTRPRKVALMRLPPYPQMISVRKINHLPEQFLGGPNNLSKWVSESLTYPDSCREAGLQGQVDVKLTYEGLDSIGTVEIVYASNTQFVAEVNKFLSKIPVRYMPDYFGLGPVVDADFTEYHFSFFFRLVSVRTSNVGDNIRLAFNHEGVDVIAWRPNSKDAILEKPLPAYIPNVRFPQFPSRHISFPFYFFENMKYPEECKAANIGGRVLVHFLVSEDGKISKPQVLSASHSALAAEALRLVKRMPRWIPDRLEGKRVATDYILPITFTPPSELNNQ